MQRRFLVGTYTTRRASRGLYLCTMDERRRIAIVDVCAMTDPSFVVLHPRLPLAYVVNETPSERGDVSIVAIDGDRLTERRRISSEGNSPCHLAVLPDASALVVGNYGCGTIGAFELNEAGDFAGAPRTWRHHGASVDARRQTSAHPHCVVVGKSGVYVTDLGQDCVVHYAGTPLAEVSRCVIHAGAGPRHLCFDEAGGVAWLSNELDNTVSRLEVLGDGRLREVDWVRTLPEGFNGRSYVSEITRHPNGRWLYVGNRGHDSVAWYSIDPSGALTFDGSVSTRGKHPRHFAITPDGAAMLVANRDSDNLAVYTFGERGRPNPLGEPFAEIGAPVCVRWL